MAFFEQLRANIRPADLLDILVISVLFYAILSWLRRHTSRAVVPLLVLAGVLYLLARVFRMYLTLLVLQAGITVILLALVIMFHEDLRRGFDRLAGWTFGRRRGRVSTSTVATVDVLTETLVTLAEQHIGALIVVRGREPVEAHIRGGVRLDGRVSLPLLVSIFHTRTPGHDGAVLLDDDRVELFSVHLPLSQNLAALRVGGTRHTAALGMAERSDALVLVVSEERGKISIAEEGQINEITSPAMLQDRLSSFWQEHYASTRRSLWRRWLTHGLALKLLSVCAACMFWFFLAYRVEIIHRTFDSVPIEYRGLPEGWVIEETTPGSLTVTLRGPERAFSALDPRGLKASLDVSDPREGVQDVVITDAHFNLPEGLSIPPQEDLRVSFRAHSLVEVELAVQPQLMGEVNRDLQRGKIEVEPPSVTVLIRAIDRSRVRSISTAPIQLTGLEQTTTFTVGLVLPEHARFPERMRPEVKVTVPISKPPEKPADSDPG